MTVTEPMLDEAVITARFLSITSTTPTEALPGRIQTSASTLPVSVLSNKFFLSERAGGAAADGKMGSYKGSMTYVPLIDPMFFET